MESVQKRNAQLSKKLQTDPWLWAGWWYEDRTPSPVNPGSSCSRQQTGLEARQSERGSPRSWGASAWDPPSSLIIKIQAWRDFKGPCLLASAAGHEIHTVKTQVTNRPMEKGGQWLTGNLCPHMTCGSLKAHQCWQGRPPMAEAGLEPPYLLTCGQLIPASYPTARD